MRVFPRRFLIVLTVALSIVALSWFMWPAAQLAESTDLAACRRKEHRTRIFRINADLKQPFIKKSAKISATMSAYKALQ